MNMRELLGCGNIITVIKGIKLLQMNTNEWQFDYVIWRQISFIILLICRINWMKWNWNQQSINQIWFNVLNQNWDWFDLVDSVDFISVSANSEGIINSWIPVDSFDLV